MHVCTNSIQKNETALLKKREVNLEQKQGCPGAGGRVRRHEHVAHGLGRREALDDVVERGRGPRDDEERALGVAVALQAPALAHGARPSRPASGYNGTRLGAILYCAWTGTVIKTGSGVYW